MTLKSFDELSYGDVLKYVGPENFDGEFVAPAGWKQPYTFEHISLHGTLSCLTKFNGKKRLSADHPANNPTFWRVVSE